MSKWFGLFHVKQSKNCTQVEPFSFKVAFPLWVTHYYSCKNLEKTQRMRNVHTQVQKGFPNHTLRNATLLIMSPKGKNHIRAECSWLKVQDIWHWQKSVLCHLYIFLVMCKTADTSITFTAEISRRNTFVEAHVKQNLSAFFVFPLVTLFSATSN